jgi:purine nucleoside permease
MKTKNLVLLLLLVIVVFYGFYTRWGTKVPENLLLNPPGNLTVILTSFGNIDDKGVWQGEVAPFMRQLVTPIDISKQTPMCQSVYKGFLYQQPVLVVVAGQAKVRMTACVMNLLQTSKDHIKEVILAGIAGITPEKGGLLDSQGAVRNSDPVMIGDVCINSGAVDFDMQHYSADRAGSTIPQPLFWQVADPANVDNVDGSHALANELNSAALKVDWPQTSLAAAALDIKYHGSVNKTHVWGPTQCLEVSDDLFWHDIRSDLQARVMASAWLNSTQGLSVNAGDIMITTAMEAVPAGSVISWWNKNYKTKIAFAYVRSASNFDQVWVNSQGIPQSDGKSSLESGLDSDGAQFAFETASLPVLKMLELRNF